MKFTDEILGTDKLTDRRMDRLTDGRTHRDEWMPLTRVGVWQRKEVLSTRGLCQSACDDLQSSITD